jgi:heat shock protein beta
MTRDDLIKNLGTIAKSGTKEFINAVNNQSMDSSALIGQFGVGFYSAFLCANQVVVASKNNQDDQHIWESSAVADFKVAKDPRGNTLGRGTQITLHLKEECHKYLNQYLLKNLILKYSQYINFPIYLWSSKTAYKEVEEPVPAPAAADEEAAAADGVEEAEDDETAAASQKTKQAKKAREEKFEKFYWDLVNVKKPIWTRDPSTVEDEEYDEFYKAAFKDSDGAIFQSHFKAEGEVEFKSILFIPENAPQLEQGGDKSGKNIRLYLKHIFITDEMPGFLPRYLSFVRGMIDSDDFPINVNREHLQKTSVMRIVKKGIHAKVGGGMGWLLLRCCCWGIGVGCGVFALSGHRVLPRRTPPPPALLTPPHPAPPCRSST